MDNLNKISQIDKEPSKIKKPSDAVKKTDLDDFIFKDCNIKFHSER